MGNKELKKRKPSRKRQLKQFQKRMEETKRRKINNISNEENLQAINDNVDPQNVNVSPTFYTSVFKNSKSNDLKSSNSIKVTNDDISIDSSPVNEDDHDLQISLDAEEMVLDKTVGRRIVAVSQFFTKLQSICDHGPLGCGIKEMQLVGEVQNGLASKFVFRCRLCNQKFTIPSDESGENYAEVNQCAVTGTIAIGCGHSQLQEILSALNLPLVSHKTYAKCHDACNVHWEHILTESMLEAAEQEKRLALEEDRLKNGIPRIDVIADGCWSKRSYKKNYNASSGAAAIIGRKTGKILYLGVKNKYCSTCTYAKNKQIDVPDHKCYKNFEGSSTSMESDIIVEGFKKSLEMYGLIYERIISDGDSSTYAKILQARPYPNVTVEKVECRNHILRNFCNHLTSLTTDTKFEKRLRALITKKSILYTRTTICKAIAKHKENSDVQLLFADILLSHLHGFGDHSKCRAYFCNKVGEVDETFKKLHSSALWQKICFLTQHVASHARSLIHDVDSNIVERYNSIVAKFVGGKRINFSKRSSYQTRCQAAAVSFNEKKTVSLLYKSINDRKSPQGTLKRLEAARLRKNLKRKKVVKTKFRPTTTVKNTTDKDYGQSSLKPDMAPDVFESLKMSFLESLKKTPEERKQVERNTVLQAQSSEWLELRRTLLTASNFGKVINKRPNTNCANFIKELLYKVNIDNVPSIKHGKDHEKIALKQLETENNISIKPCGLHLDADLPFLGATPDGLCGDNIIVEIKCPITAHRLGIQEAIKNKKVTFWKILKNGQEVINQNHPWYYQIQGQLHITGRSRCLLAVWSSEAEKLKQVIIDRDDQFWTEKMEKKLKIFYMECILPELIDPRHPRGLPIRNKEDKENNYPDDGEMCESQDIVFPELQLPTPSRPALMDIEQPTCSRYLDFNSY